MPALRSVTRLVFFFLVLSWTRVVLTHETVTTTVLFDREIVRILDRHCVMCHVEGGPSFPLATYEQVWLQKRDVSAAVLGRHMPPWAAIAGYGRFANENVVTLRESQFIVSWMEGLGPRNAGRVFTNTAAGDGERQAPAVRARAEFDAWHVGEPDLTRELDAVAVDPGREDEVKRTVVDLGTTVERRVRAVEYRPGDRRVVRAAFLTVQETGQWIGSWTPWYGFMTLPAGVSYSIPAGAHLVVEVHYRRTTERVVDRGRVGLFFDASPSLKPASDTVLEARAAAGAGGGPPSMRFRAEAALASETVIVALRPVLPPGATSIELSAKSPDGGTRVLLFAKDFPVAWPTPYIFKEPVVLPRGTRLVMTAYVDAAIASAPGTVKLVVTRY
jgi:hypothetical protein